jgi:DNA-binding transcriptional MerR regulator
MDLKRRFKIEEAARQCGIETSALLEWIKNEWIQPSQPQIPELDEEDVARISLIRHLQVEFEINDPAMPIILHLLDQIYHLHFQIRHRDSSTS